ncbi:hypothetical protein PHYBOEH_001382 [Phytophthora boehmeriae]|uniref:Uncharacterized protein n=1 Tax=Phytophthora boehmeriae TaxID=109152 RepID=A0A8T1XDC1_9STRA|nr:hypothetical protein PHYBOEH_001382 [Phytophthora boehmeriae]
MLSVFRSPAIKRVVLSRGISHSRALQLAIKPPMTSLNNAATMANLELNGTLEEVASTNFSESSSFPDFSPMEDTLLGSALPKIPIPVPIMDAHALAEEQLTDEALLHFSEASVFPEWTPVDEVIEQHRQ